MNRNEVEDELNKLISMMMLDKPFKQTVYMWQRDKFKKFSEYKRNKN